MKIFEYRGVEGAVYAPIVTDDDTTFETGTVKSLAGVSEIAKSTDSSNEAHYYDNIPAVVVGSTGSDEITINSSAIPLDVLAEITGQYYDEATGMMVEQERTTNGQEITYTGISTTHKFTKTGKSAKAVNVDTSLDKVDTAEFFKKVQTPDSVTARA